LSVRIFANLFLPSRFGKKTILINDDEQKKNCLLVQKSQTLKTLAKENATRQKFSKQIFGQIEFVERASACIGNGKTFVFKANVSSIVV
jgi:hypothetical protein